MEDGSSRTDDKMGSDKAMNPQSPNINHAIQQGWISEPQPMKPVRDKWVARNYALGLTARGTPRKPKRNIRPDILAAAKRDGVSVAAIYNRIKRTGRMTLK